MIPKYCIFALAVISLQACAPKLHEKSFGGATFGHTATAGKNETYKTEIVCDEIICHDSEIQAPVCYLAKENITSSGNKKFHVTAPTFVHSKTYGDSMPAKPKPKAKKGKIWRFPLGMFLLSIASGLLFIFKGYTWALLLSIFSATALVVFLILWLVFLVLGLAFFGALFVISH